MNENTPTILKRFRKPIFKKANVEFDKEMLVIKQQLLEEDSHEKDAQKKIKTTEIVDSVKVKIKTHQVNKPELKEKKKSIEMAK